MVESSKKGKEVELSQALTKNLVPKQNPMLTKVNNKGILKTKIVALWNGPSSSKYDVMIEVSEKLGGEKKTILVLLDSEVTISGIHP